MPSSAYYMRVLVLGKTRFPSNQAIPWQHFPTDQPNEFFPLKRESAGTPIVVTSKDFQW